MCFICFFFGRVGGLRLLSLLRCDFDYKERKGRGIVLLFLLLADRNLSDFVATSKAAASKYLQRGRRVLKSQVEREGQDPGSQHLRLSPGSMFLFFPY